MKSFKNWDRPNDIPSAVDDAADVMSGYTKLEEKDMTAISSWKKKIKKVKGLTKQQIQMLNTLPTPVVTSLINQIGMVVSSNDVTEDGHTQSANIKNQLNHIKRSVEQLMATIQPDSEYPAWLINKLVKSADYLDSASDYLLNKVEKDEKI